MSASSVRMQRVNRINMIFMLLYMSASVAVSSALFFYLFYSINLQALGF